jgi:molybdate transport system substrate-binding protein
MRILYSILFLGLLLSACQSRQSLKIATSANMAATMNELITEFNKSNSIEIDLIISSSGQLTSKIEQGAPYDIFVAANTKYPQYLYKKGLTLNEPKIYGRGQLVLWGNFANPTLEQLTSTAVKKIAIANPETAPYGKTSVTLLKNLNIYESIKHKLVYGESISQVNQFIHSGSVDIGITSLSTILSQKSLESKYWFAIDLNSYQPIQQSVCILKSSSQNKVAQKFIDFMLSDKGKFILMENGYLVD